MGEPTRPPFGLLLRYASGIEDWSRLRFWTRYAAEDYARIRQEQSRGFIIGWEVEEDAP